MGNRVTLRNVTSINTGADYYRFPENELIEAIPATLYVATDGDDAKGNGSSEYPFATARKALDSLPRHLAASVTIRIKAGTYATRDFALYITGFTGAGYITITSDSGEKDVMLNSVNNTWPLNIGSNTIPLIMISNLGFGGADENNLAAIEAHIANNPGYINMLNCDIVNTQYGIYNSSANLFITNCVFKKSNVAINAASLSTICSINNSTISGVNYGLRAGGGIIVKSGAQPTGIASDEVIVIGTIL